jgi:hypothetical protein
MEMSVSITLTITIDFIFNYLNKDIIFAKTKNYIKSYSVS